MTDPVPPPTPECPICFNSPCDKGDNLSLCVGDLSAEVMAELAKQARRIDANWRHYIAETYGEAP